MQTIKLLRPIYFSALFLLSVILIAVNSGVHSNDLSNQIIAQLVVLNVEERAFEIIYRSLVKGTIPVGVALWLTWILIINAQFKIKKGAHNIFHSIGPIMILFFSLLAVGLSVSLLVAFIKVHTFGPYFKMNFSDFALSGLKGFIFALSLFFLIKLQKKFFRFKKTISTVVACLVLIHFNIVLVLSLDYTINFIFT